MFNIGLRCLPFSFGKTPSWVQGRHCSIYSRLPGRERLPPSLPPFVPLPVSPVLLFSSSSTTAATEPTPKNRPVHPVGLFSAHPYQDWQQEKSDWPACQITLCQTWLGMLHLSKGWKTNKKITNQEHLPASTIDTCPLAWGTWPGQSPPCPWRPPPPRPTGSRRASCCPPCCPGTSCTRPGWGRSSSWHRSIPEQDRRQICAWGEIKFMMKVEEP